MRIFIVGATGVLGRDLVPLLVQAGHTVLGAARSDQKARQLERAGAQPMRGDLLDADASWLGPALDGCDVAIHAATSIPTGPVGPGSWDANTRLRTDGTRRLLDAALAAGVRRYVQQSIVMAYPDGGDGWLDESTSLSGSGGAGSPVVEMERMVRETPTDRLAWCILRGGAFVGPDTSQLDLLRRIREGSLVVPGDGSQFLSPVHVTDVASAFALAAERAPAGSIFNVNADDPPRYGEYVDALADRMGTPHPRRDPNLPRPASCRASNRAAREQLGWQPTHSIYAVVDQ